MKERIAVTGGLGFIGSEFLRRNAGEAEILNIDADTYAGDVRRIASVDRAITTELIDLHDPSLGEILASFAPACVIHFAAETHVTRSESAEDLFTRVNVHGTKPLLDAAERSGAHRFVHISTDEVYGPCLERPYREDEKEPGEGRATSPYARSKALADDLVLEHRGEMECVVVRPTNCFGPWQHPEKAIPRWITRALMGQRLPVWGDGRQVRQWLHVSDVCAAIESVLEDGRAGAAYNIGPPGEAPTNVEVAHAVARHAGLDPSHVYLTAYDRPAHDRRYAVDSSEVRALGWKPAIPFDEGLRETIGWYAENRSWWSSLIDDAEVLYDDREPADAS